MLALMEKYPIETAFLLTILMALVILWVIAALDVMRAGEERQRLANLEDEQRLERLEHRWAIEHSYEILQGLADEEAIELCYDYRHYYLQEKMDTKVAAAFEKKLIATAAPHIEAQVMQELQAEEDLRARYLR